MAASSSASCPNKDVSSKTGSQQTFLQMLKNSQLSSNLGDKLSKAKQAGASKSSPQASNLYQLLLQEKQNTQSTHQAPLFGQYAEAKQ